MSKIHLCYLLIILGLLVNVAEASIIINEIQYNPTQCSDAYCEWIELYNPTNRTINLTNWKLCSSTILPGFINHSTREVKKSHASLLPAFSFGVITDGGSGTDAYSYFDIDSSSYAFHVEAGSLCGGLSDSHDIVLLEMPNGTLAHEVQYSDVMGADGNNYTLERRNEGTFGQSIVEFGTPGSNNSIAQLSAEYSVLTITEVMPNPFGADDSEKPLGEWVEIFNSGKSAINLAGLFLTDEKFENELFISDSSIFSESGTIINANDYKVIFKAQDSDFSLNNNGYEEVHLYTRESDEITKMSYSGSTEGMSWSELNGVWYTTEPTPGSQNSHVEQCDWEIFLEMPNTIFTGDDFDFKVHLERLVGTDAEITVRGRIENINGEVIKTYSPWTDKRITTTNSKTYSPNLQEGTYQLTFEIEDLSCNDFSFTNNKVQELIAINQRYLDDESTLNIENMYLGSDKTARWGDQFRVRANVYRGDASKYAVELWAEKDGEQISKRTKINVHDRYSYYDLTIPLFLDANCDDSFSDGKATLMLEGLDVKATEHFVIEGHDTALCNQSSVPFEKNTILVENVDLLASPGSISSNKKDGLETNILNRTQEKSAILGQESFFDTSILEKRKGIVVYESSSVKAAKLVPFFMIFCVSILIFLFFKKEI